MAMGTRQWTSSRAMLPPGEHAANGSGYHESAIEPAERTTALRPRMWKADRVHLGAKGGPPGEHERKHRAKREQRSGRKQLRVRGRQPEVWRSREAGSECGSTPTAESGRTLLTEHQGLCAGGRERGERWGRRGAHARVYARGAENGSRCHTTPHKRQREREHCGITHRGCP
eukprot:scaffold73121_cov30-Tisochrysis_lutea.AAC.1